MDNMFSQETWHYVSKLPLAGASATRGPGNVWRENSALVIFHHCLHAAEG